MNLPTERFPKNPESVGVEGGGGLGGGVAALDLPVEWNRFCYACNGVHVFVADRECAEGLIGKCANCDDERIASFTRVTTEAA